MNLFQKVDIVLNSGKTSDFKIECDALTDEDIECVAYLYSKMSTFRKVFGVPTGGLRLEKALEKYCSNNPEDPILICDDVLTTGASMEKMKKKYANKKVNDVEGFVIFARGKCPDWIDSFLKIDL